MKTVKNHVKITVNAEQRIMKRIRRIAASLGAVEAYAEDLEDRRDRIAANVQRIAGIVAKVIDTDSTAKVKSARKARRDNARAKYNAAKQGHHEKMITKKRIKLAALKLAATKIKRELKLQQARN